MTPGDSQLTQLVNLFHLLDPAAPSTTKAALKSKIVAEFTVSGRGRVGAWLRWRSQRLTAAAFVLQPQSLLEHLSRSKRAAAEEELKEKQLGALRVDLSPEALKRLKGQLLHLLTSSVGHGNVDADTLCPSDKTEGNKFAKDFEENSQRLQEFVGFLEKELKSGPPLIDALGNADIFYEMQYKEVKIVANVSVVSWSCLHLVSLLFNPPSALRPTTPLPTVWPV